MMAEKGHRCCLLHHIAHRWSYAIALITALIRQSCYLVASGIKINVYTCVCVRAFVCVRACVCVCGCVAACGVHVCMRASVCALCMQKGRQNGKTEGQGRRAGIRADRGGSGIAGGWAR